MIKKTDNFLIFYISLTALIFCLAYLAITYHKEIKAVRYDNFQEFEKKIKVDKSFKETLVYHNVDNEIKKENLVKIKEVKSLKDLNKNLGKESKFIVISNSSKNNGKLHINLINEINKNDFHMSFSNSVKETRK